MFSLFKKLGANRNLLKNLILRDIKHRYVGSIAGFLGNSGQTTAQAMTTAAQAVTSAAASSNTVAETIAGASATSTSTTNAR